MAIKRVIRSRSFLALLLIFVFVATVLLERRFGYDTYRVDGWCLRFKSSEVEWPHGSPFLHTTTPFFFVRVPIPYDHAGAPSDQGVVVHYWKKNPTERQHRIDESGSFRWGCNVRQADYGLVELFQQDGPCFSASFSKRFEPETKVGLDAAVSISCSKNTRIKNCTVYDVLPNSWEANIAIPKTSLSDWRVATAAARDFFEEKLQDCESK